MRTTKTTPFTCNFSHSIRHNLAFFTSFPPYAGIPHFRGDLFTGRLPYVKGDQLLQDLTAAAKLGDIISFWLGNRLMILLNDPELIYDYKVRYQTKYTRSVYDYLYSLVGYSVVTNDTLTFRQSLFNQYHGESFIAIEHTIATVSQKYISALHDTMTIEDANKYFRLFALELAMKCFMGVDKNTSLFNKAELEDFIAEILQGPKSADVGLRFLNLLDGDKSHLSEAELAAIETYHTNARDTLFRLIIEPYGIMQKQGTLLDDIWHANNKARKEDELTYDALFPDALIMLLGGEVTTLGDGLMIILEQLAKHNEIRDKLVSLLIENKLSGLTYLEQIIKESFRLQPPLAIMPAGMVEKPFELNGITINAGDYVLVSPYLIQHHPEHWPDPEVFNPDRFANHDDIKRGSYLAFGLGGKSCPGQRYTMEVLKTFIATLLLNFDIALQNRPVLQHIGPAVATMGKMHISLTHRDRTTADFAATFKPGNK